MNGCAKTTKSDTESLFARMGFVDMTPIQRKAVPRILQKRDCLVVAPTGSGKTECATIPIFHMLGPGGSGKIRCLYITPLRALNRDVFRRITRYAESNGLAVRIRHGDTTQAARRHIAQSPPDVLITTPETVAALLSQEKMLAALSGLRWVVVDEVHELLPNERGSQLALSLERLQMNSAHDITRIGLSATVGNDMEASKFVVGTKRRCLIIRDSSPRRYEVEVRFTRGGMAEVAAAVSSYVAESGTDSPVLLFANTRGEAELLASMLKGMGTVPVEMHHGSLSRQVREEAESSLRRGGRGIVVCTSSLELGLDIGSVEVVVHYGSPRQVSKLVQRIGRSRHRRDASARGLIIANRADDEFESRAIIQGAARGLMERQRIHQGPLDVLAHHLVGLLMQKGPCTVNEALAVAVAAYPFRNVTAGDICDVLALLEENRVVNFDRRAMSYRAGSRAFRYHYQNLSTIPDTLKFRVFDSVGKKVVGTLDQRFVGDHGDIGNIFVLRGSRWRILAVDDETFRVSVEPFRGGDASVPYWEGESIPVDYATARAVGDMRDRHAAGSLPMACAPGGNIPRGTAVVVECNAYRGLAVVHACFGTRINLTLAALLSSAISEGCTSAAQSRSDAYRMVISSTCRMTEGSFRDALLREWDVGEAVTASLNGTHNMDWRVWVAAKRFGAIPKDAAYEKRTTRILRARYDGTPLVREAVRELFHDKYDISGTERILEDIRSGAIPVLWQDVDAFSPMAEPILDHAAKQLSGPAQIDPEILEMVKERLQKTRHRLVCVRCGRWQKAVETRQISRVSPCPYCHARQIASTFYSDYDLAGIAAKRYGGKKLDAEEDRRYRRAWKSASLIEAFGTRAITVLSGYGVGVDTGARILRNMADDEDMFRQIYLAERQYVMTRGFWDQ